jgi:hypothetical protein
MRPLRYFETSSTNNPVTQHHIPERKTEASTFESHNIAHSILDQLSNCWVLKDPAPRNELVMKFLHSTVIMVTS